MKISKNSLLCKFIGKNISYDDKIKIPKRQVLNRLVVLQIGQLLCDNGYFKRGYFTFNVKHVEDHSYDGHPVMFFEIDDNGTIPMEAKRTIISNILEQYGINVIYRENRVDRIGIEFSVTEIDKYTNKLTKIFHENVEKKR